MRSMPSEPPFATRPKGISGPRGRQLSASRNRLAVEAHVDGHLAETRDLEWDRQVLADRVLRRRAGEPEQHRVRRLFLRLLLGEAGVLAGQAVLRVAADPEPFAQVLRAAFVEVGAADG